MSCLDFTSLQLNFYNTLGVMKLLQENAKSNFDETVEAHVRLGVDRKRSDLVLAPLIYVLYFFFL